MMIRIPDYELLFQCGKGGFGEVWIARGLAGETAAVKILPDAHLAEKEFQGLQRCAALPESEYRVRIRHVGRTGGVLYYVMERADDLGSAGQYEAATLDARMRYGRLKAAEVIELGRSILTGIRELHEAGLCHRDVKPANVIFVNGKPKLSDLGLLCPGAGSRQLAGTPGFIPPEKMKPDSDAGSGLTDDLYAAGKLLYCCWTNLTQEHFPELPPECLADECAPFLNSIITRAAAAKPEKRFASAAEFLAALAPPSAPRFARLARWKTGLKTRLVPARTPAAVCRIGWACSRADLGFYGRNYLDDLQNDLRRELMPAAGGWIDFIDLCHEDFCHQSDAALTRNLAECCAFIGLDSGSFRDSPDCARLRQLWLASDWPLYAVRPGEKGEGGALTVEIRQPYEDQTVSLTPWSRGKNEIKLKLVEERLNSWQTKRSCRGLCTILPELSRTFTGRLTELLALREACAQGQIPVIRAAGGTGKTELAAAYAFLYADAYPEGRLLLRMEGAKKWPEALFSLLTDERVLAALELNEKLRDEPESVWHPKLIQALFRKAARGPLLLLLDNMDDPSLLTEKNLRAFSLDQPLPANLHLVATSRLAPVGVNARLLDFPLKNLDEASSLALFQKICGSSLPFPAAGEPEYAALLEIIRLLEGHVWSLELAAGYLAVTYADGMTFQKKLDALKKDAAQHGAFSYRNDAENGSSLLEPTLEKIRQMPLGKEILELGTAAAMFPPDQIPMPLLQRYWKNRFPDAVYEDGEPFSYAQHVLTRFHLLRTEEDAAKMHRMTRTVLLHKSSAETQLAIARTTCAVLTAIRMVPQALRESRFAILAAASWCREWQDKLPELREDLPLIRKCIFFAHICRLTDATALLQQELGYLEKMPLQENTLVLRIDLHLALGRCFLMRMNRKEKAGQAYQEALQLCMLSPWAGTSEIQRCKVRVCCAFGRLEMWNQHYLRAENWFRRALDVGDFDPFWNETRIREAYLKAKTYGADPHRRGGLF